MIAPQPGPQTAFATTDADVAIYGGSAAGGKTWSLTYEPAKLCALPHARAVRAVLLRRNDGDLTDGGGLWDTSAKVIRPIFGATAKARTASLDWVIEAESGEFADLHRIAFDHCKSDAELERFDGTQFDFVGFDQLEQFTERQFFYITGRLRSTSGIAPRCRATCNPKPGWLHRFLAWWIGPDGYAIPERSGVVRWFSRDPSSDAIVWFDSLEEGRAWADGAGIPVVGGIDRRVLSCTFVLSLGIEDNPALLTADPAAAARQLLWTREDRLRLVGARDERGRPRGGCWLELTGAGRYYDVAKWIPARTPPSPVRFTVRAWDRAGSEPTKRHPDPDQTCGVLASICEDGEVWIREALYFAESPVRALGMMLATAEDDGRSVTVGLYQDTGGAGKNEAETTAALFDGYNVEIVESFGQGSSELTGDRVASRSKRALNKVPGRLTEEGRIFYDPEGLGIAIPGPHSRETLRTQCYHFPTAGTKDDGPDALALAVRVLPLEHASLEEAMAAVRNRARSRS